MKIGKIWITALALLSAAAFTTGCDEREADTTLPAVNISPATLSYASPSSSQTIQITASRDWEATTEASWIAIEPSSGQASTSPQTVTITVLANTEYDRSGKVVFDIAFDNKTLVVTQEGELGQKSGGEGTISSPYTVEEALNLINTGAYTAEKVYVEGIISEKGEINTTNYGNATYYISDDGTTSAQLEVYRGYYLGGAKFTSEDQISVGDTVVVYGVLTMYNSTPEVTQGSSIYSLNGVTSGGSTTGDHTDDGTTGTSADPYTVNKVLYMMENSLNNEDEYVYVKGKVSEIKEISTSYGNGTYYISDDGTTTDQYYIFRGYYLGNVKFTSEDQISVGDEVVVYGKLITYNSTYEMAQGNYIYSLNGTSSGSSGGESGEVKTVTVAEFLAASESSSQQYQLTGTIGGSINTTYGNFDLTDATGTVYVYGLTATDLGYGTKNDQSYASLGLKEGDTVTIIGYRGSYNGKDEVVYAHYVSHTSGSSSEGESGEVKTVTVAEFLAASESSSQQYQLTGTIGGSINTTYGNFDLTDDTGTVYVYGLTATDLGYGTSNDKSYSSLGLKEGDTVTLIGYRGSYNGKDEVLYAYYVSHTSGSSSGGGDDSDATTVTITLNSSAEEWSEATHAKYGSGYTATSKGFTISYYKYDSTNNLVAPKDNHIRVYKDAVLVVDAPSGKTISKIVFTCTYADKCCNMTDTSSGSTIATADTSAKTITYTGSTSSFKGVASNGQVQIKSMEVTYK